MECSVSGCSATAVARSWCPKHWWRWRNYGDPDQPTVHDLSAAERFWGYVRVGRDSQCWLWTGAVRGDGYGAFQPPRRKQVGAHRFSYELEHGEIPAGMVVMHSCDAPRCVNPRHLRLGTHLENQRDAARKGRKLPGSTNHQAKLTEEQVRELRDRYAAGGIIQSELAAEYGISRALVSFIITRKAWKHI